MQAKQVEVAKVQAEGVARAFISWSPGRCRCRACWWLSEYVRE